MFSKPSSKVKLGKQGEDLAVHYLQEKGFRVQERNFRTRWGEIDIVASKGGEYYFVEVKTRTQAAYGHPLESLPFYRVERLKKMALFYATRHRLMEKNLHLSLLGVDLSHGAPEISFVKDILE